MKKSLLNFLFIISITLSVSVMSTACNWFGDSAAKKEHAELAEAFVSQVNGSTGQQIKLVKTHTLQSHYIVVVDPDNIYHAYYIGDYTAGVDINSYLANCTSYDNLTVLPGHYEYDEEYDYSLNDWITTETWIPTRYRHDYYQITFEETEATSKDLEKMGGLFEKIKIQSIATSLSANYGLSESRSIEIAKMSNAWSKTAHSRSMTDDDANAFFTDVLGSSLTDIKKEYMKSLQHENNELSSLIELAAQTNGIGPEHMKQILDSFK